MRRAAPARCPGRVRVVSPAGVASEPRPSTQRDWRVPTLPWTPAINERRSGQLAGASKGRAPPRPPLTRRSSDRDGPGGGDREKRGQGLPALDCRRPSQTGSGARGTRRSCSSRPGSAAAVSAENPPSDESISEIARNHFGRARCESWKTVRAVTRNWYRTRGSDAGGAARARAGRPKPASRAFDSVRPAELL